MNFQVRGTQLPNTGLFIDGEWLPGAGVYPLFNPADGSQIAEIANCDASHAIAALDAAARAQRSWASVAPRARANLMHAAHRLMLERESQIVRTMTLESGKPLTESKAEFNLSADFLLWFAEQTAHIHGTFSNSSQWRVPCGDDASAGRALPPDHALELSPPDDRAKGRRRACRGLHDDHEIGSGNSSNRRPVHRDAYRSRLSQGCRQPSSHDIAAGRLRDAAEGLSPSQSELHRFDPDREPAAQARRGQYRQHLARARRRRPLHRARRCGRRSRRRTRFDLQVPQRRAGLRRREPHHRRSQGRGRVHRANS